MLMIVIVMRWLFRFCLFGLDEEESKKEKIFFDDELTKGQPNRPMHLI